MTSDSIIHTTLTAVSTTWLNGQTNGLGVTQHTRSQEMTTTEMVDELTHLKTQFVTCIDNLIKKVSSMIENGTMK